VRKKSRAIAPFLTVFYASTSAAMASPARFKTEFCPVPYLV